MDELVIEQVLHAIDGADWARLRFLLHPYLHWSTTDGTRIRGRTNVLARLREFPPTGPPRIHELRDGQIYRWVEGTPKRC
ncbi:MAG: nuclear transport factor 2 family protein [Candidatus Dormibacteraeota bacterium]|nr:nuclear transport factor 2 family protein [Candidatus Dormibacteraeota bacterium]